MRLLGGKIYYGWLALAAISGINFANSVTSIGMLTVFVLPMSDEFGWNRTQISGATSVGAILGERHPRNRENRSEREHAQ